MYVDFNLTQTITPNITHFDRFVVQQVGDFLRSNISEIELESGCGLGVFSRLSPCLACLPALTEVCVKLLSVKAS